MINYVKRYEPKVVQSNDEMNNIYGVHKQEVERLHGSLNQIKLNSYVQTMDIKHIRLWEKILKIKVDDSYTLQQRRRNVLNTLLFKPPFTRQRLNDTLYNIWGEGNYQFEIFPDDFRVIIDIDTFDPVIYLQFTKLVRRIIPANMFLIFSIQYTYLFLQRNKTYNQIQELTYQELRQYSNE